MNSEARARPPSTRRAGGTPAIRSFVIGSRFSAGGAEGGAEGSAEGDAVRGKGRDDQVLFREQTKLR